MEPFKTTEDPHQMSLWPLDVGPQLGAVQERPASPSRRMGMKSALAKRVAQDVLCFWAPVLPSMALLESVRQKGN